MNRLDFTCLPAVPAAPGMRLYFVALRTECGRSFFADWRSGRCCAFEIMRLHKFGLITSVAWTLLPDRCYWLVVLNETPLHYVVMRFKIGAARRVNRLLHRKGTVWRPGYFDRVIATGADVAAIGRYIVSSPIRAGLVDNIGDYPLWDIAAAGRGDAGAPMQQVSI